MPCANEMFGLLRLLSVGLAYLIGTPDHPVQQRDLAEAWQVLSLCAETASFDGAWTLSLKENGTAVAKSDRHVQLLQGHWQLVDAGTHTYRIDVLAFGNDFVVVPTAAGCLLGSGTLRNVDLRQSWFTHGGREAGDLMASATDPGLRTK
ncbi:hypothetical protein QA640_12675 [Bradyrhizobium sp. CB82]|uniref:hypothetical protein n=1 Tax=Bradyrhizobium sp. CB82 TaxID=3039159 RepID=UPI0024B1228E|nr:hypothetical protein [Bradyrhizobium sp. CB82]WFU43222.1 hypothetical protein QA640_12675 [Bradyrhizobium sp. CB82]